MGTVSDACGRRKRGYAAAPPDAPTHTVSLDFNHSQAAWRAAPRWQVQVPACVASLPLHAEQRAMSEALNPAINATGWRQCGGTTAFSQLNNPQHNPQEWVFSLSTLHRLRPPAGRSDRLRAAPLMADDLLAPTVRDAPSDAAQRRCGTRGGKAGFCASPTHRLPRPREHRHPHTSCPAAEVSARACCSGVGRCA